MPTITCLESAFAALSIEAQYQLVHHEFAGLAGIERGLNGVSDYSISEQISAYLEDVVVKKLAVKSLNNSSNLASTGIVYEPKEYVDEYGEVISSPWLKKEYSVVIEGTKNRSDLIKNHMPKYAQKLAEYYIGIFNEKAKASDLVLTLESSFKCKEKRYKELRSSASIIRCKADISNQYGKHKVYVRVEAYPTSEAVSMEKVRSDKVFELSLIHI